MIYPEIRHPKKNKMMEFNKVFFPEKIMKAKQVINYLERMKIGDNNVEDDNNDGDGAVLLAPNISPQFDSKDLYKVLGVSMNATEQQIKRVYRNLARRHHPDCISIHLSKDDSNRNFTFIYNAYEILGDAKKRRVHDTSLRMVKYLMLMRRALTMKIEMIIIKGMMMMAEMLMKTHLLKKTVLGFHVTEKMFISFAILLGCNHPSAKLMVAIDGSI